jgi:hypothetical protein
MELKDLVTLVAAVIAAIVASISLFVTTHTQRLSELRAVQRKTLEPHLVTLGEALHNMLASSRIYLKTRSPASATKWLGNAHSAQRQLKDLRPKLRYSLWGVDETIRVLSRVPNWIEHLRGEPERAERMLDSANALRERLDECVRHCYRDGRQPSWLERRSLRKYTAKCESVFSTRPSANAEMREEVARLLDGDSTVRSLSGADARAFIELLESAEERSSLGDD